jgi:hypothetical protein
MNKLSTRLGYWTALLCGLTFILFTVCFIAILIVNPLFIWTNFDEWVSYSKDNNQFFKHLAQLMMLLFGPLFVILANSIHDYAQQVKKTLTRLGLGFALLFAAMTGIHYFLQITTVRLNLGLGQAPGLEMFI